MPVSTFASSAATALRIASLDLCADEYALTFARQQAIVSVSHLGANAKEFALAARAGGIHRNDGSLASVARLKPDLVLTSRPLSSGGTRLARRLGIRVYAIPYASTPVDVRRQVESIGSLIGSGAAARRWIARFDRLAKTRPAARRALFLGPTGTDVGPLNRGWFALAGIDPFALPPGRSRIEQIARLRPDVIVESDYRAGDWHRGSDWKTHRLVADLRATRYTIDGRAMNCGGPAMLDAVAALKAQRG